MMSREGTMSYNERYTPKPVSGAWLESYDPGGQGWRNLAVAVIEAALSDLVKAPNNMPRRLAPHLRQSALDFFFNPAFEATLRDWCQKAGVDVGGVRRRARRLK
jgi:hypothetical protein